MSIILGVDPGSRVTGYGVIDTNGYRVRFLAGGVITLAKTNLPKQLREIFLGIANVVKKFRPDEAAVEQVFVHLNANASLKLGQARGAALVALAENHISIAEYAPKQIKQAVVGFGAADKNQVQQMVKSLLKLDKLPSSDVADALACAICHAHSRTSILKSE